MNSLNNPPIGGKLRQKPWEAIGMSRAGWYRHGKPNSNPKWNRPPTQKFLALAADNKLRTAQRSFRLMKWAPELWDRVVAGK
jgi:hypothetical protein